MIATDEQIAVDASRLCEMIAEHENIIADLVQIARRLRERFPQNEEIQDAVERFLTQSALS